MASFHWIDYVVWAVCLGVSLITGIVTAWRKRHGQTMEDYVLGGRAMLPGVVMLSLLATQVSSSALILAPVEVYLFGTIFVMVFFGQLICIIITTFLYLPIYHRLKLTSAYEYMEARFQSSLLRTMASVFFTICILLQCGLVLYVPSLAFNQVTGIQIYVSVIVAGVVCTAYTVCGGMRSVVWVDALQTVIFIGGMILFVILGGKSVGSLNEIVERAKQGGRFDIARFSFDPRARYSVWTITIGYAFSMLSNNAANQVMLQRVFSIKDLKDAKRYILGCMFCSIPICLLYGTAGIVMYAFYAGCDPISTRRVQRAEQLLPDFVMTVAGNLHGLPGLYMAAVFAASLSTLSSFINSLSAVCVEDFLKPFCKKYKKKTLTEKEGKTWCMIFATFIGILSIVAAFLPHLLGALIIQLTRILVTSFMGPILTVFTLGIFVPFANKWGAFSGMFSCLVFALWMSVGSFYSKSVIPLPLDTSNCSFTWPPANFTRPPPQPDVPFQALYDVSYLWVGLYSLMVGLITGIVVSIISSGCRRKKQDVHPSLLYSYTSDDDNDYKNDIKDTHVMSNYTMCPDNDNKTVRNMSVPDYIMGADNEYNYDVERKESETLTTTTKVM